jgi:hypothetical protein
VTTVDEPAHHVGAHSSQAYHAELHLYPPPLLLQFAVVADHIGVETGV